MTQQASNLIVSIAEAMNPSKRHTMEDVHVTLNPGTWGCNDPEMAYIGVYDGHGGRDTVDFLENALHQNIAQELNMNDNNNGNNDNVNNHDKNNNHDVDVNVNVNASTHVKIERAFLMTDVQSQMSGIQISGATVALCLIKKHSNGKKITIHSANAGDGRAVLSCQPTSLSRNEYESSSSDQNNNNNNPSSSSEPPTKKLKEQPTQRRQSSRCRKLIPKAHRLTCDHKADNIDEIKRIESSGGFLLRNRVLGIMAVARSLGDHGMKEYVIGRPFIDTVEIDLELLNDGKSANHDESDSCNNSESGNDSDSDALKDEFVILACDGLWDTMEDQEAVDLVRKYVKHGSIRESERMNYKEGAAKMLCKRALQLGSTDNITVIVAWL